MLSNAVRTHARTAGPECQAEQQGVLPKACAQIVISQQSALELDCPAEGTMWCCQVVACGTALARINRAFRNPQFSSLFWLKQVAHVAQRNSGSE